MIALVLTLVVLGVLLWAVEAVIPMDATIRQVIRVVVLVCVLCWLLSVFGVLPARDLPVPRLR